MGGGGTNIGGGAEVEGEQRQTDGWRVGGGAPHPHPRNRVGRAALAAPPSTGRGCGIAVTRGFPAPCRPKLTTRGNRGQKHTRCSGCFSQLQRGARKP